MENSQVWEIYLNENQFDLALEYCRDDDQRDIVTTRQAKYYFLQKRYLLAAKYLSMSSMSVEDATMMLHFEMSDVDSSDLANAQFVKSDTLRSYLVYKQQSMDKECITQKALLSTWILNISLKQISQSRARQDGVLLKSAMDKFATWLKSESVNIVDSHIAFEIFAAHGCMVESIEYAAAIADWDKVITFHLERGEWTSALSVLAKNVS